MKKNNEIVPIQLKDYSNKSSCTSSQKSAFSFKTKTGCKFTVYNGINSYILNALIKELM